MGKDLEQITTPNKSRGNRRRGFQNTSANADTYDWDFGNGLKSTDKNPSTQYDKNGDYSVVLIAKASKSQDTKIQRVTINTAPKPVVGFTYVSQGSGVIRFTNISTNADTYKWTFSNGTQSTEKNPTSTAARLN